MVVSRSRAGARNELCKVSRPGHITALLVIGVDPERSAARQNIPHASSKLHPENDDDQCDGDDDPLYARREVREDLTPNHFT